MTRFLLLFASLFLSVNTFSQNADLSDYSFVIVPNYFDFLKSNDQYQINTMTKFYFEKSGFNAYMASEAPNANRCDGLYSDVEELRSILGTKLQVVLRDCNDNEVYRSSVGKSKYKEFKKTYQDALRKAFNSIETLGVKQKDVVLLPDTELVAVDRVDAKTKKNPPRQKTTETLDKVKMENTSGNMLPASKFSNYSHSGKTYLLRKTTEGYSLYEESATSQDGLVLKGKVVVLDKVVKYMDTAGNVSDASFDTSGDLTISDNNSKMVFKAEN
jgi:hypothetical protein